MIMHLGTNRRTKPLKGNWAAVDRTIQEDEDGMNDMIIEGLK